MLYETVVRKGTDDETDFQNYIGSCRRATKMIKNGVVFIDNISYSEFKDKIDGTYVKWSDVIYMEFETHYELWLEVEA